jgi:hypothetical protein
MGDVFTVDDVAAGFQAGGGPIPISKLATSLEGLGHFWHSLWYDVGFPGPGAAPSSGLNGGALSSDPTMVTGQIPFTKAAAGNVKRLGRFEAGCDRTGVVHLFDRLWANSGFTITQTTEHAITPVAAPARDANGNADGEGVIAAIECSVALGNGAVTNTTLKYTNSEGVALRTGTIASFPATAAKGTLVPFQLQAGDRGVRSIQGLTLGTTYVSGTIHLVLLRHLASLPILAAGEHREKTWDQLGIPRLYDGSVPFLAWGARDATGINIIGGNVQYIER